MKYLVVQKRTVKETNPYYHHAVANIEPEHIVTITNIIYPIDTDKDLADLLSGMSRMAVSELEIYEIARKVKASVTMEPKLKIE